MASELRTATTLTPDPARSGRYHAHVSADWTIVQVFGGVSMYCALHAMSEHLARDDLELQSAHTLFLAPVPPGELTLDIEVLRGGRRTAQLAADLRPAEADDTSLRVHAVFGAPEDPTAVAAGLTCPDVPPPSALETRFHDPSGFAPMEQRMEWRPIGHLPGTSVFCAWERLRSGHPDRAALAVHGDILGAAVEAISPRFILSLDIGIRFVRAPVTPWVLQEAELWHLGGGYVHGPVRLWDEAGHLCAIVHQTALVRPSPQG